MITFAIISILHIFISFLSLNDFIKYENFIKTPFDDHKTIKTYIYNDIFYYCKKDVIVNDTSFYFDLHCNYLNDDHYLKLKVPKFHNSYPNTRSLFVLDFSVNQNYIGFLTFDFLYIYKINSKHKSNFYSDSNYTIYNIIAIEKTKRLNNLYFGDSCIVLTYDGFNSTVDRNKKNIYIAKLDNYESQKMKYEYINNNEYSALTMFQPRNITSFDINNNLFFVSEILDYKVRIYSDTTLIDSISIDMPTWNDTLRNQIKKKLKVISSNEFVQPKEIISQIEDHVYQANLIKQIQYLKNNKLLVVWEEPHINKGLNLHFDLWEKLNGHWTIKFKDIRIPSFSINNKIKQNSYLSKSVFDLFECNKLVCYSNYKLNMFDDKYFNMTTIEFKLLNDKELEKDELKVYYYIFNFEF